MELERARAVQLNIEDPIFHTKQETDDNYNLNIERIVNLIAQKEKVEVMIASHNQKSVRRERLEIVSIHYSRFCVYLTRM